MTLCPVCCVPLFEAEMEIAKTFVTGIIAIGVITALFLPGRQTVRGIQAIGSSGSGLIRAAMGR